MARNLNNRTKDYNLAGMMTAELIDVYGFELTYVRTARYGHDILLGDIINYGTDKVLKIVAMPENAESFDSRADIMNKFGLFTLDSMNLFISATTMSRICNDDEIPSVVGDVIILPSGKYLEVLGIEHQVPGLNNNFVYSNKKNVYKISCGTFNFNHDDLPMPENEDIAEENGSLDEVFNLLGKSESSKENIRKEQNFSDLVKNTDEMFNYLDSENS